MLVSLLISTSSASAEVTFQMPGVCQCPCPLESNAVWHSPLRGQPHTLLGSRGQAARQAAHLPWELTPGPGRGLCPGSRPRPCSGIAKSSNLRPRATLHAPPPPQSLSLLWAPGAQPAPTCVKHAFVLARPPCPSLSAHAVRAREWEQVWTEVRV